jgi:hypothetical protein
MLEFRIVRSTTPVWCPRFSVFVRAGRPLGSRIQPVDQRQFVKPHCFIVSGPPTCAQSTPAWLSGNGFPFLIFRVDGQPVSSPAHLLRGQLGQAGLGIAGLVLYLLTAMYFARVETYRAFVERFSLVPVPQEALAWAGGGGFLLQAARSWT